MRTITGFGVALVLTLGLVAEVHAQRAAAPNVTRLAPSVGAGARLAAPATPASGVRGAAANPLTTTQDIRVTTPGRPETRIIVRERPATPSPTESNGVGPVARTPREVSVIVEESASPGAPPVRQETRIFIRHPDGAIPDEVLPIIVLPE